MKTARTLSLAALTLAAMIPLQSMASHEVFRNGQSLYGQSATSAASARTFDLTKAQSVNVQYGETVLFKGADGKQFSWTFNGLDQRLVQVAEIAPRDFSAGQATVVIGRDPQISY